MVLCHGSRPMPARQQRSFSGKNTLPRGRKLSCQSTAAEVGKLITKTEIPAFIPRRDLMDQLSRWAVIEVQESGVANVGMPCKVCEYQQDALPDNRPCTGDQKAKHYLGVWCR